MNFQDDLISKNIISLLREKFFVSETILNTDYWDEPLPGNHFRLTSVDLIYLFFELEKTFELRINECYLSSYGFSSINKIADIIRNCCEEKVHS